MTPTPHAVGTRVRVRRDPVHGPGPWPGEPTGTVVESPDHLPFTVVPTLQGPTLYYWVDFDEPQFDADGDGPYASSQVTTSYIELLFTRKI